MQNLANDEIWQYVRALGKSGSKKVAMATSMTKIYRVICVTAVKVLSITIREARTAVSTYLKNTANRASSKQHKQNLMCRERLPDRSQATGTPRNGHTYITAVKMKVWKIVGMKIS